MGKIEQEKRIVKKWVAVTCSQRTVNSSNCVSNVHKLFKNMKNPIQNCFTFTYNDEYYETASTDIRGGK